MSWLLLPLLVLAAFFGAPLFSIIAGATLFAFASQDIDTVSVAIEMYRMAEAPMLIAIPLFTFAGYLLSEGGAPRRLLRLSRALLGWMPGGLAVVSLVACAIFTAFTGASGVTVIAMGGLLLPALLAEKYSERFTFGLLTTSGSLGLLFPPSLPIILVAYVASVSVDQLFVAGIVPGTVLLLLLGTYAVQVARRDHLPRQRFSWRELAGAARAAAWGIPLPFVVLGGIYSGKVTVTEAASLTAMYALLAETLVYRDIRFGDLRRLFTESMVLVGGILIILGTALGLTNYLIDAEVPNSIFEWIQKWIGSRFVFLVLLNVFLLIVGCMMDIFSAILVVMPLILPVAKAYEVNPVHLGIIFLANLEIGYFTPPVGLNLFIGSFRFGKPVMELARASLPFLGLYILALLLITYVPALSLWLIHSFGVR
ncbi:MAG TPA: TRAP transporter large permease subunit [Candidatus Krumholzibacteria bacterium]|nr:TRAP transporter large permease subunit [Candidatus Krumholzibacteria bacterium]